MKAHRLKALNFTSRNLSWRLFYLRPLRLSVENNEHETYRYGMKNTFAPSNTTMDSKEKKESFRLFRFHSFRYELPSKLHLFFRDFSLKARSPVPFKASYLRQ